MDYLKFRKDHGLTQAQAGALIGASRSTWGRLERGDDVPEAYRMAADSLMTQDVQPAAAPVVVIELPENTQPEQSIPVTQTTRYLTLRSHAGRKVMTFADIANAYEVAESTVRRAFSDNRERWSNPRSESEQECVLTEIQTAAGPRQVMLFTIKGASRFAFHLRSGRAEQVQDHCLELLMSESQPRTAAAPDSLSHHIASIADLIGFVGQSQKLLEQQVSQQQAKLAQLEEKAAAVDQHITERLQAAELERRIVADMRGHIRKSVNFLVGQTQVPHRTFYAAMHFHLRTGKLDDIQGRDQAEKALAWLRAQAAERGVILGGYQQPMDLQGVANV